MSLAPSFFESGPAQALRGAAARLGLALDPDDVQARFEAHAAPQSLRALVEIAPAFGLLARAFKSDLAGLGEARLPAVVHLVDAQGSQAGFGLLVERRDGRLTLHDAEGAPSELDERAFARAWTGILVTLERAQGVAVAGPRRGGPLVRLGQWWKREDPLARAATVARALATAGLGAAAVAGAARFGAERAGLLGAGWGATLALLAMAALGAGLALFYSSRRTLVAGSLPRLATTICGRGAGAGDCTSVLSSRYSRIAGIDWSSLSIAFYASTLLLAACAAAFGGETRRAVFSWLALAFGAATLPALAFIGIQAWPLRRFCRLCMTTHAVTLATAASLVAAFAAGALAPPGALAVAGSAHALLFLAAFGLLVPFLSLGLESRANRTRLGWIAATPYGALAETAGRPRAARELPDPALRLCDGAPFRLDALVHPACSGCGPVAQQLAALAGRCAGRVAIGLHPAPRDPGNAADFELCAGIAAAGLVAGPTRGADVFLAAKQHTWRLLDLAKDGAARVCAELAPGVDAPAGAFERAREAVRAADALATRLERGTPTLLVNGWLWDGSLDDFEALLQRQPELLAQALRLPASAR